MKWMPSRSCLRLLRRRWRSPQNHDALIHRPFSRHCRIPSSHCGNTTLLSYDKTVSRPRSALRLQLRLQHNSTTALEDPDNAHDQAVAMGRDPPHLARAKSELKLLQQILGLLPDAELAANLQDAVFVCIDCEAFEADHEKVTEIGVAVLDTRTIRDLDPGDNVAAWVSKMEYAHYRPIEHAEFVNRRFVKGCEESFGFGVTTWINLSDAREVLDRVFGDSAHLQRATDFDSRSILQEKRNVIFVAHGLNNDKTYLSQLGFPLTDVPNITHMMDTQVLAGATKKAQVALQRLLVSLGLDPVNLHNAGNDAAYTLQAMVLMAVKDFEKLGSVFEGIAANGGKMLRAVRTEVKAKHVYGGTALQRTKRERTTSPGEVGFCTERSAQVAETAVEGEGGKRRKLR